MRFSRFRIRTLMIAIAAIGILTASAVEAMRLRRIASERSQRAKQNLFWEQTYRQSITVWKGFGDHNRERARLFRSRRIPADEPDYLRELIEHQAEQERKRYGDVQQIFERLAKYNDKSAQEADDKVAFFVRLIEHHARLGQKYQRAASRPWESIQPDPPVPPSPPIPKSE